ncbi:hypothetical protein C6A86_023590 [Mycobacterium sp. ITM-2016-00316]|uniref:hypothetical protein n=1 Tax=Mycobacterium sp. ITM-2016-00316 TaxID=2099695 RepID=UPI000CF84C77|nr:hypothetical protein [Mycobacterium sp. ITM-2016-00316]WNG81144.1 hypothetical protein C6A86_023590 [Mycobacterium sp. ITM-2016-00316]
MANWNDVAGYLRQNFKIKQDSDTFLTLVFDVGGGRSQLVMVSHGSMDATDEEFAIIASPIADARITNIPALLDEAADYVVGGVVKVGETLALRHAVPLSNLDLNELMGPLELVMTAADHMESKFTGADRM